MKHVLVAMMLCLFSISANAGPVTNTTTRSWAEVLVEKISYSLTGTQQQTTNTATSIKHLKHRTHRSQNTKHAHTFQIKSAYVTDMTSHVHISKNELFQEFEDWRWFQLTHTGGANNAKR